MRAILIGVAAVALAAGPALAQGNGKGNSGGGKGGGMENAAQSMQVSGQGGGNGGGKAKADRGNAGGQQADRGSSGPKADRGNGNGNSASMVQASMRGGDKPKGNDREVRSQGNDSRGQGARKEDRGNGRSVVADDNRGRGRGRDDATTVVIDRRGDRFDDDDFRVRDVFASNTRGLIAGCPPGLAKKNPPCVPPGQARNDGFARAALSNPDWWGLSGLSGRYTYDNGYLYRLNDAGRIGGFIPLLGGALGVGNPWPSFYDPVPLPSYYQDYYGLGPSTGYRYADDVIYRVDPQTSAITSIAALLTGDRFNIGQPMPLGYDVYNVPYAYRDRYYDTPDSLYRYSDGYVYQVDPKTQLIAAVIELLT